MAARFALLVKEGDLSEFLTDCKGEIRLRCRKAWGMKRRLRGQRTDDRRQKMEDGSRNGELGN